MAASRTTRIPRLVTGIIAASLLAIAILVVAAAPGHAQKDPYSDREPRVEPSLIIQDTRPEPPASSITRLLPFTGAGVTTFLLLGLGAVASGTVLVRRRRPDEENSEPE